MIEKEFVPYELAIKLKELGFNEPCLKSYGSDGLLNMFDHEMYLSAPLFQQSFRWFREKYDWTIEVNQVTKNNWSYTLKNFSKERMYYGGSYETFEVAEIACLEKLIEFIEREK